VPKIKRYAGYIFDVDGTLVDSAEDICSAIQGVLVGAGRNGVSDEYLRSFIGRHLYELWDEVFPDCSDERRQELLQQYRGLYTDRKHASTRVFPGVREALSALRGRKSTATTKSTQTTRSVLELFELLPFFDHVQGTDGFPAKPNPDVLFRAMEGLRVDPAECLFVGDSAADMEAAQRAGIDSCAVTYGYGKRDRLESWSPTYFIGTLGELLE
jgi:HAD superfamily hydrolase (TIGR01509 family)